MHTLHISLLGDFRLVYGTEPLTSVNTPRLQALLVYLLLHRQAPQPRQHIAFQFWPDSSEKQAHTNLRKLLFQLRNALPDPDRFLTQDHLTVHWRPDAPYTLDVAELRAALARSRDAANKPNGATLSGDLLRQALTQVVELYQGELLPGSFEEWLLPLRQTLQQEVMDVMERLIVLAEHQRDYQAGIRYGQRLLGLDPLQEGTYRRLMQLHALNGDRAAALHNYHTCATMLQQELGVDPADETRSLYEQLLKQTHLNPQVAPMMPTEALLVGRQAEWQMLVAAWRQAQQGQAHLVALTGEAGIGKSRLLAELMRWVRAQGGGVAHSRFYEAEVGLAYAPLVEWLRSPRFQPLLAKLAPSWLSEVARLLPELLTAPPALPPPRPLVEAWERQRFIEALARAILLDKGPLLLVIDDLQWADSETLTWLRYLLRYAPQARLLVVCAWRSEAVDETPRVQVLLRDLQHTNQATTVELPPLSTAETVDLAQQLTGGALEAQEADQLLQATEGHPLFLVETLRTNDWRLALRSQSSGLAEHPLPLQIQRITQARLRQLSPAAHELAGVAATLGRRLRLPVLQQAGGVDEETLVQALEELWQRRIIREQGSDAYDFSHDQMRATLYQGLSQARRRLLHRRVAAALEAIYAQNLAPVISQLALHYLYHTCNHLAEKIQPKTASPQRIWPLLRKKVNNERLLPIASRLSTVQVRQPPYVLHLTHQTLTQSQPKRQTMSKHHGQTSYFIVGEGFVPALQSPPALVMGASDEQETGQSNPERAFRFSRMFPSLPRLVVSDERLTQLGLGMIEAIENRDEKTAIPAGYTYLGQFIDHDITFDQTEGIPDHQLSIDEIIQGRSPSLDLDSLYGRGPTLQPELYVDGVKLRVGTTTPVGELEELPNDLLRLNVQPPIAVIGDPRNDENLAVAQTHLAFIKFHNAVVTRVAKQDPNLQGSALFHAARTLVVQHYQHVVLTDFLPRLVEESAITRALAQLQANPVSNNPAEPTMPIEFAAAAFRLGHSMVRQNYSWNKFFPDTSFGFLFAFSIGSGNLLGSSTLPSNWVIDWRRFYEIPARPAPAPLADGKPNMTRKIDTSLASVLGALPNLPAGLNSLAARNLLRGSRVGLPSGQAIAQKIEVEALDAQSLKNLLQAKGVDASAIDTDQLAEQTPLWFYILAEAEINQGGDRLGPVGSHILATTFVDLIARSQTSILRGDAWQPSPLLRNPAGHFDMAQLLLVVDDLNPLEPKFNVHLPLIFR